MAVTFAVMVHGAPGKSTWTGPTLRVEFVHRLAATCQEVWRGPGQEIGEFTGISINAEARMKAESWTASVYAIPEFRRDDHRPRKSAERAQCSHSPTPGSASGVAI